MASTAHILYSNSNLDDYWQPYCHFIQGKLIEIIREQEIYIQEYRNTLGSLLQMLQMNISLRFKESEENKAIRIKLINDVEYIYEGNDPFGYLEISDIEDSSKHSIFKAIVKLTNYEHLLYVRLEFDILED